MAPSEIKCEVTVTESLDGVTLNDKCIEPSSVDEAVDALTGAWASGTKTTVVDDKSTTAVTSTSALSVVCLRRLNRIQRVERESGALIAEAGTTVESIREAAAEVGLWCPALRWLPNATTIGTAVAGGHGRRSRRYGAVADYVLGLRFATPSCGLVHHGGMAIKNATGYNLSAMVAGSRGSLGVVLEVILRLVPMTSRRGLRSFTVTPGKRVWLAAQETTGLKDGVDA